MHGILNRLIVSIACLTAALFTTSTASAYEVTVTLNAGSTVIANGFVDNGDGTVTADLTVGDIIALDIWAANAAGDTITGVFTSLEHKVTQVNFLGGGWSGPILTGTCTGFGCSAPSLSPGIGAPQSKPNDPCSLGTGLEDWIQIVAHTNTGGSNGTGAAAPGDRVTTIGYTVEAGAQGIQEVAFISGNLAGDGVSSGVTSESYGSLTFNLPEPGALAASLAALGSVVFVSNRRRLE